MLHIYIYILTGGINRINYVFGASISTLPRHSISIFCLCKDTQSTVPKISPLLMSSFMTGLCGFEIRSLPIKRNETKHYTEGKIFVCLISMS